MTNRTTLNRRKRKKREGEFTCHCAVYKFPHRMFGGACDGGAWVDEFFEQQMYGACKDCILLDIREADYETRRGGVSCQVLDG